MLFNLQVKSNSIQNWLNEEEQNLLSSKLQKGELGIGYSLNEKNEYSEFICRMGPSDTLTKFSECPVMFQYPMLVEEIPQPEEDDDYSKYAGTVYHDDSPTNGEKLVLLRTVTKLYVKSVSVYLESGTCDVEFYSNNVLISPKVSGEAGSIITHQIDEEYVVEKNSPIGIRIENSQNAKGLIVQVDWKNS